MKYKIRVDFMHGDADNYDSKIAIFDDKGDTSKIKVIRKFLSAYEQSRDVFVENYVDDKDEDLSDFIYEHLIKGDVTCDGSNYASCEGFTITEVKPKVKSKKTKLKITDGKVEVSNLLECINYAISIREEEHEEDEENDDVTEETEAFHDGFLTALGDLKNALSKR